MRMWSWLVVLVVSCTACCEAEAKKIVRVPVGTNISQGAFETVELTMAFDGVDLTLYEDWCAVKWRQVMASTPPSARTGA